MNHASGRRLESFTRPRKKESKWFKEWQVEAQAASSTDRMFFQLGWHADEILEVIGHETRGGNTWMKRARERFYLFEPYEILRGELEGHKVPDSSDVLGIPSRFDIESGHYRLREDVDRAGVEFPLLLMFYTARASHLRVRKEQFLELAGRFYDRFVHWPGRDKLPHGWPDQVKRYIGDKDAPHTSRKNLEADIEIVRMVRHCYWLMLRPQLRGKIDRPKHIASK